MKSVMSHQFSNAPTADVPRSSFDRSHGYKTTFNAGDLIPVYCDEALPGDTLTLRPSVFARLNTPIYPLMDNMFLDIHFFQVPVRQIWDNFRKFCGEQTNPNDSTDYLVPEMASPGGGGYSNQSLQDYLGLPTQISSYKHSALFTRAYNHIYNEWYRDQNLIDSAVVDTDDGPDLYLNYSLRKRGKRHDYFTSCLPWLQKGDGVGLPLGDSAPIIGLGNTAQTYGGPHTVFETDGTTGTTYTNGIFTSAIGPIIEEDPNNLGYPNIRTDLSQATASTINELRQAFQIQKLLERDARSGTRYSEIIKSHFGVNFLDVTYRPEFLGGSSQPINMQVVPQTSESSTTPQGTLSAYGTVSMNREGGFTKSFTEHSIVMGIASVRADLTYQQGLNRMFSRRTRYDYYWPALAHIGEQSVLNKEIYMQDPTTHAAENEGVFGYQERWSEYRYKPSMITGKLRSNDPASLDSWHLSQEFSTLPGLNQTFIEETPPIDRVVAVPSEPDMIMDCHFSLQCARVMPLHSVPGLIDHF